MQETETNEAVLINGRTKAEMIQASRVSSMITDKLHRVLAHIGAVCRELKTPANQWAYRIVESRIRQVSREYLAVFGTTEPWRTQAIAELQVAKPDDGTIFLLNDRNHAQGRLDCRACDPHPDDRMAGKLTSLCPHCAAGIYHSYTTWIEVMTVGGGEVPVTPPEGAVTGESTSLPVPVRVVQYRYCDNCGVTEEVTG